MTDFDGRNVLITGAASGLGRLLARRIAARGGCLILWDKNVSGLDTLRDELRRQDHAVSCWRCDLSDRAAVYRTAASVEDRCGPVDVLVNNAGVVTGKSLLEATDEEILLTFDVNALALLWTTRAFLPAMIERNRGHIVTVASAAGLVGVPRLADYSASKFAAVGFDESLRLELRHRGLDIRTTVVCPYYMNTGMFAGVRTRFPALLPLLDPADVADRIVTAIAGNRQRLITPRFVSLLYLARLLPPNVLDAVLDFLGVTASMDAFHGGRTERAA